ncbi:MAG TPA: FKBP-type peptidyl-prolyl cis-trans isomerase [bacterium]|nr:FKBP-type peptidyl-prolyl cis-trans isomerase [bacterium]
MADLRAGPPTLPAGVTLIQDPSGLEYVNIEEGSGRTAGPEDRVHLHWIGWLAGGRFLESTRPLPEENAPAEAAPLELVGEPRAIRLGDPQVLAGWTIGIAGMKEGARRRLIIPSDLAYGPRGKPPSIPPYSTLIYDIELVRVD